VSQHHTLVLNADAQPMGVLPLTSFNWMDAIQAFYLDKVDILASYENWTVRSPSRPMQVPAVVMKREYVNITRMISFSPDMVKLRDGYRCLYCGESFRKEKLTCDHVIPESKGGKKTFSNIVSACGPCNSRRGNDERIQPRHPPYLPSYHELVTKRRMYAVQVPHASWIDYIGWAPHLVTVVEPVGQPGYTPLAVPEYGSDFQGDVDQDLLRKILLG
jgi:5-methylcytosine-specific restriction endonuclease McrA